MPFSVRPSPKPAVDLPAEISFLSVVLRKNSMGDIDPSFECSAFAVCTLCFTRRDRGVKLPRRLRWAEKTGTGFTLPGHQQAAAEASNGKPGKLLQFRKVG